MSALSWSGLWTQPSRASLHVVAAQTGLHVSLQMSSDGCIVTNMHRWQESVLDQWILSKDHFYSKPFSKVNLYPT